MQELFTPKAFRLRHLPTRGSRFETYADHEKMSLLHEIISLKSCRKAAKAMSFHVCF